MQNYHKHSMWSNIYVNDSTLTYEDYAIRAVELNQRVLSSVEHYWQGDYYGCYEIAKTFCINHMKVDGCTGCKYGTNKKCPHYKTGLKFVFGSEVGWVKNKEDKDRTNSHMVILAKNENGRRAINRLLSDASENGYYYVPRTDINNILQLPPNDIIITTACIKFWVYEDIEEIIDKLHNHFKDNFYLEIQPNSADFQLSLHKKILNISRKKNIKMIVGMDTHYVDEEQRKDRIYYLEAHNCTYGNEDGYLGYPNEEEVFKILKNQNIFTDEEILKAIKASDIILTFDDFDFNKNIKLPTIYPNLSQEEKDKLLAKITYYEWQKHKKDIPKEKIPLYEQEIKKELRDIFTTKMSDYFLLDYSIVKEAKANGGKITKTGRGSSVSFYVNTLLGFSNVDRISSKVKLYPERFMSATRILETKSLPDLDLNIGNPEVFIEAQSKIMGEGHSFPLVAFRKLKTKSAWKMYTKARNVPFDISNEISDRIGDYEKALKYAPDDEKDTISIYDFIDKKYHKIFEESKKYRKMIDGKASHPCFVAGTKVLTKNGYVNIEDIKIGNEVMTHTNKYQKVLKTMNKEADELYKLKVDGDYLEVTGNHPMYVIEQLNDNSYSKPKWVNVEDLTKNHKVGLPVCDKKLDCFKSDGILKDKNSLNFETYDLDLAMHMQLYIHKFYKKPSIIKIIKVKNKQIKYKVTAKISEEVNDENIYLYDHMWIPVKELIKQNKKATVYNLSVANDNSYTVNNKIAHNCGHLLYQGDIRSEIGLMKCKSEATGKEVITTVIDGMVVENYKFLKNDQK